MLLVQRGREMGYALDDEQFEEILEGIKEENSMTDEQLVVALAQEQGMNLGQLRGVMEDQMLVGQVQQDQVLRRVSMTDTEALEYYETHPEEYTEPATVVLREILVTVPVEGGALNVARENLARSQAESALARVRGGEAFEAVVSELSDSASAANGGLIGPIALADLAATVRSRIEVLEVGEVGEIERTPGGYQILKLESSTAAAPAPFEEVREQSRRQRVQRTAARGPQPVPHHASERSDHRMEGRGAAEALRGAAGQPAGPHPGTVGRPGADPPSRDRIEVRMTSMPRPAPDAKTRPRVSIGSVALDSPFALAPMAGMTDTAFRRLVKRGGGCGLVVTEMVSSEGLVRGIDRTLEYAEYTEEERPVSIQIFGATRAGWRRRPRSSRAWAPTSWT